MLKEPSGGSIGVAVTRGEQCLLATDSGEAHGLELGHGGSVELGLLGSIRVQLRLAGLASLAPDAVKGEGLGHIDGDV